MVGIGSRHCRRCRHYQRTYIDSYLYHCVYVTKCIFIYAPRIDLTNIKKRHKNVVVWARNDEFFLFETVDTLYIHCPRFHPQLPTNQIYILIRWNYRGAIFSDLQNEFSCNSSALYLTSIYSYIIYVFLSMLYLTCLCLRLWSVGTKPASECTALAKYIYICLLYEIHYVCGWLYMHIIITKKCFLVRWKKK